MWKTLALVADEEVRATAESVRSSNVALNQAAVELQEKVKVLLGQYAAAGADAGGLLPGIAEGCGGPGAAPAGRAAIEQASALLGRLVEQPPSMDTGEPNPNQILTPRAKPLARDHRHGTAAAGGGGPGAAANAGAGTNKLRPYLLTDVPSLKWETCSIPGAEGPGGAHGPAGHSQLGPRSSRGAGAAGGGASRRPLSAASGGGGGGRPVQLEMERGDVEEARSKLQESKVEIAFEAQMELRGLHADVSPIGLHHLLLEDAVKLDSLPERDDMLWYKMYSQEDLMASTRHLLVALFHTAADPGEAWARITDAFMHGLALPDPEAARRVGRLRKHGADGTVAEIVVKRWTPDSYPGRFVELQKTMDKWLKELLEQRQDTLQEQEQQQLAAAAAATAAATAAAGPSPNRASADGAGAGATAAGGAPRGAAATPKRAKVSYHHLEYDFATYKLNIMPFTYLQMVGQKLLFHATQQLPCLIELPERIPDWVIRTLYAKPFAEAVRLAIQSALAAANEPRGTVSALVDERAAGSKQYRTLLQSRDERRRREARARAVAQGGAGFGPQDELVSTWGPLGSGGSGGGSGGGGGGDGDGDGGADDSESALGQARHSLGFIMYLFKDVAAFEKGFGEILSGAVLRHPARLEDKDPDGRAVPVTEPVLPSVPAFSSAAYLNIIHEEVSAVVRDMRPALRNFITHSLMSAVQACLAADSPTGAPPYPVMVSFDAWPKAEFMELSDLDYVQAQIKATGGSVAAALSTANAASFSHALGSPGLASPASTASGAASSPALSEGGAAPGSPHGGGGGGGAKSRKPQPPLATAMMRQLYSRASSLSGVDSKGHSSGGASSVAGGGAATPGGARTPAPGVSAGGAGADTQPLKGGAGSPATPVAGGGAGGGAGADSGASPADSAATVPVATATAEVTVAAPPAAPGAAAAGGGGEEEDGGDADKDAPEFVDVVSQRVLEFVAWLLSCLGQYPETVQAMLAAATLECLSLLMDRLASVCTTLHEMPRSPLPLMFLFHSAACCVRRRLESFKRGLDVLRHDEQYLALLQQHGECLVQADELVSSIHRHIVMAYKDAVHHVVLSAVDRTDWCAFKPEVMRGKVAGPAVRVWHAMMVRLLHSAARYASLHAAEWVVGQVLQESLACLAQRYLLLCPSYQMRNEFVADAVHAVSTVFLLCQPIPIRAPAQRNMDADDGGGGGGPAAAGAAGAAAGAAGAAAGGDAASGPRTPRQQQLSGGGGGGPARAPPLARAAAAGLGGSTLGDHSAMAAAAVSAALNAGDNSGLQVTRKLRVPPMMVKALAGAARELLVRAALLQLPAAKLEALAVQLRLLPEAAAETAAGAAELAAGAAGGSASTSGDGGGGGGGGAKESASSVEGLSPAADAARVHPDPGVGDPASSGVAGRRQVLPPVGDTSGSGGGGGGSGGGGSGPGPVAEGTLPPPNPSDLGLTGRTASATGGGPRHRLAATTTATDAGPAAPPAALPSPGTFASADASAEKVSASGGSLGGAGNVMTTLPMPPVGAASSVAAAAASTAMIMPPPPARVAIGGFARTAAAAGGGLSPPTVEIPGSFGRLISGHYNAMMMSSGGGGGGGGGDDMTPRTAAAVAEAAEDAATLTHWSAWLPGEVLVALRGRDEAISLTSAFFVNQHMPLGDRLADRDPAEPWLRHPQAQGAMWRRCLDYLAANASADQVLEALARRHELHAKTGAEPNLAEAVQEHRRRQQQGAEPARLAEAAAAEAEAAAYWDGRQRVRLMAQRLGLLAGQRLTD